MTSTQLPGPAPAHSPAPTSRRARLLVVDDEESIRELLTIALGFAGFEVFAAVDGTQAVAMAGEVDPDVLILDVLLPDADGFAVTRTLRGRGMTVPVLFLSACDEPADVARGLAAGGDDYLVKPFGLEALEAHVRALLDRARDVRRHTREFTQAR